MPITIHSEETCRRRIREIEEKYHNFQNGEEMSLGDSLLYENFTRVLKEYAEERRSRASKK